jgi:hypothetical protein
MLRLRKAMSTQRLPAALNHLVQTQHSSKRDRIFSLLIKMPAWNTAWDQLGGCRRTHDTVYYTMHVFKPMAIGPTKIIACNRNVHGYESLLHQQAAHMMFMMEQLDAACSFQVLGLLF